VSHLKRFGGELEKVVCGTGQHRALLHGAFRLFDLSPDFHLDVMEPGQSLTALSSRLLAALDPVLRELRPDLTVVQGDTATAFCGALASFYAGIPVAHVEAGLRTFDPAAPFPEEMNRAMVTQLAALHFAPTEWAATNLQRAGVPDSAIHITGNTAIDSVLDVAARLEHGILPASPLALDPGRKLILVTAHRRENSGKPLEQICSAVAELARRDDVEIVWPVHPNPDISATVRSTLDGKPNIRLVEPLEYAPFIDLVRKAHILLTDSGGIQEEAPALGKPVLVLREKTERPEAVAAGTVKLVGHNRQRIIEEAMRLLEDSAEHARMSRIANPYGDGQAGARIAQAISDFLRSH
jgi:UDP-N-acetylglucosamine 2-epimerase